MGGELAILQLQANLIVSIQGELSDTSALELQGDLLRRVERGGINGLVLEVSALEFVDSFIARVLMETSVMARAMNVVSVVVGLRPEIAMTLIQMGFGMDNVRTAIDLEHGLEVLKRFRAYASQEEAEWN